MKIFLATTVGILIGCIFGVMGVRWLEGETTSHDIRYVENQAENAINKQPRSPHELTNEDLRRCSVTLKDQNFPGPETILKPDDTKNAAITAYPPEQKYSDAQLLQCVKSLDSLASNSEKSQLTVARR